MQFSKHSLQMMLVLGQFVDGDNQVAGFNLAIPIECFKMKTV